MIDDSKQINIMCREKIADFDDQLYHARVARDKTIKSKNKVTEKDFPLIDVLIEMADDRIEDLERQRKHFYNIRSKHDARYRKHKYDLDEMKKVECREFLGDPASTSINRLQYKAPWRDEKAPSLVVYTDSNSWYDFGESCGGSVIDLVMKLYDTTFERSLKIIKDYL